MADFFNDCFDMVDDLTHHLYSDSMFKYMDMELYVPKAFMFT